MANKQRYIVPVEIEVSALTMAEAEAEVLSLVRYAFDVSNDEGRFKTYRLHETSDTIPVQSA